MQLIKTRYLTPTQYQQIDLLWNKEYPINLKNRYGILLEGVEKYTHYLIEDKHENVVAWAVEFEKDNERRFSIIVSESQQGKGFGKLLLNKLKVDLGTFYGWVIDHNNDVKQNGKAYLSPLLFYVKQGFSVLDSHRIDTEMLKAVKVKFVGLGA